MEQRSDFRFFTYPGNLPPLTGYILLTLDAPPLDPLDANRGLFIVDATWRYAEIMLKQLQPATMGMVPRSIPPHFRTAYPRCQTACTDPDRGLASIEAIFVAYHLLHRDTSHLLDNYHWKDAFLQKNSLPFVR